MAGHAQNIYLESKILSADPVELVRILYQSAVESVESARYHLKQGDIRARAKQINRAMTIVSELSATLNQDAGGELSRRLRALYDYIQGRLVEGNVQQSDPPLAEASRLLSTVLEGWTNCKVQAASAPDERFMRSGAEPESSTCDEWSAPKPFMPAAYGPPASAYGTAGAVPDAMRFAVSY